MSIKHRVKRLEEKVGMDKEEIIIEVVDYSGQEHPDPETQIAEAMARGERLITVVVPYEKG